MGGFEQCFFFPVRLKSARETHFFGVFGFFHGQDDVFTHTFFRFFHALFFFSRALVWFFFTGKNLVSRGEISFFPQFCIFSQLSQPSDKILFGNPYEIEYKSIIFRDQ